MNFFPVFSAGCLAILALACGGSGGGGTTAQAISAPGAFSTTGSMSAGRNAHAATLLSNGKVLVVGGVGSTSAELYDPSTGHFSTTGAMTLPGRESPATALLADGQVLVTGGLTTGATASATLYNPTTGAFSPTGSMHTAMYGHTATRLPSGKVLIAGYDAELYDPATSLFTYTAGTMGQTRSYATATLLTSGKVLIVGGDLAGDVGTATALLYDPSTGLFTSTGSMIQARRNHTATLLSGGKVLITGGSTDSMGTLIHATAELYDPSTGQFAATGSMSNSRDGHTATLLSNGKVLIAGGYSGIGSAGYLATAELYDPTTGLFTSTNRMTAGREDHTATLLGNGKVLIIGGADYTSRLASAELYW